jgi:AraC-like DNA-binding protein
LNENVSIDDMAAHIGYSQSHFHYLFKSYTQHTPYAYFLSLKINQARYLLLNTDKTLTEISGELGFCKVSQFSSAFKKELHITPAKFRKQRDVALYND